MGFCCSIPVFRYALEHWKPEAFVVHVVANSALSNHDKGLVERLEQATKIANIRVNLIDRKGEMSERDEEIVRRCGNRESPWILLEASKVTVDGARFAWDGPLSEDSVNQLLDSPIRHRVCEGLVANDSVAWIFLESGDRTVDDSKYAKLETELRRLERTIELPAIDAADLKDLSTKPDELKLRFSAHRLSRNDPAESVFVSMLLSTESDLQEEYDKGVPMAFPVFGRGRVLYALLGEGISTSTIDEASRFLAGACQCTVKAENPGVDLLVSYAWDENIQITSPDKESRLQAAELENTNQTIAIPEGRAKKLESKKVESLESEFKTRDLGEIESLNAKSAAPPLVNSTWLTFGTLAALVGSFVLVRFLFSGAKS